MNINKHIEQMLVSYPAGFDLSLQRIRALLVKLGCPHLRLPPVIHVAGTNGKGSVIAYCRAILEAAGYRVHVHTSPHLVNYNERYRLGTSSGGKLVSDSVLYDAITRAETANDNHPVTVFELLTATTFILFSEHPADIALIEVGLGGRLDATNVIENPCVSVITPISLDHQTHLGETIEAIAFEKAGIIKSNAPVVSSAQNHNVRNVLEKKCIENNTSIFMAGQDFSFYKKNNYLVYKDFAKQINLPLPELFGSHQLENAATAIAAVRCSGFNIPESAYKTAMGSVKWPGRMQRLKTGKITRLIKDNSEIWIDGGHNQAASATIVKSLKNLQDKDPCIVFLICGMLNTKDHKKFLQPFLGAVKHVYTVPITDSEASCKPIQLSAIASSTGLSASPVSCLSEAFNEINKQINSKLKNTRILICGSLYLIGSVLRDNGTPPI